VFHEPRHYDAMLESPPDFPVATSAGAALFGSDSQSGEIVPFCDDLDEEWQCDANPSATFQRRFQRLQ